MNGNVSKYWTSDVENSKDIYIKEAKKLYKELVPQIGETEHGNLLRLMNNYIYELHNNGMGNWDSYESQFKELIKMTETIEDLKLREESKEYIKKIKEFYKKVDENALKSNQSIEEPEEVDCDCGGEEDCHYCGGEGWYIDYDNYDDTTEREEHWENEVVPLLDNLGKNIEKLDSLMDDIVEYVYEKRNNKKMVKEKKPKKLKKTKRLVK